MSKAPRKTLSVARAVTRSHHWGGSGAHWTQEIRKGAIADAFFTNVISEETFDEREARRASMNLKMHGSFVAAVRSHIVRNGVGG